MSSSRRGLILQERDIEMLRGLFESRLMTIDHAGALYFGGRREAAKKRIQSLAREGLVGKRLRRPFEPSVLFFTRKAFSVLSERGELHAYPKLTWEFLRKRAQVSELTLCHELSIMDVKASLCPAVNRLEQFEVVEFSTWPRLYQFQAQEPFLKGSSRSSKIITVKPDGFIRIHEREADDSRSEHTFFLEVDRSSEPQQTLLLRAHAYLDYYRSGGLAVKHGRARSAFKEFPFRVLMVFRNAERRNNTAEKLLQHYPPILRQVWLTTMEEVTTRPLDPIWIRPVDYRDATANTTFDPERRKNTRLYKREPERERLVEGNVCKRSFWQ